MSDPFDLASECLRQVLPLMSRQRVPVIPNNYAVWYEYVAGVNPELREAMDALSEGDKPIDEAETRRLYDHFLAGSDSKRVMAARDGLKCVLDKVSASISDAGTEVVRYEESLKACEAQLSEDLDVEDLRGVVTGLTHSTHQMHDTNEALRRRLEESTREADALRAQLAQSRAEATTDPLTGLANRKGFDARLSALEASEEYEHESHCLLIGDIDKFKNINDTYGHVFGDKIIKVVATAFKNLTKGKDLAARFGGEEFVILLPSTGLEGGRAVAESIRSSIERGRVYNPKTGEEIQRVTISVGVTELIPGEPIGVTIARADEALYKAKNAGRNRVEVAAVRPTVRAASA